MIKCTFIKKDQDGAIAEEEFFKTEDEINSFLKDNGDKIFSVHVVDEYILVSKDFTKDEMEAIVAPKMIEISGRCINK